MTDNPAPNDTGYAGALDYFDAQGEYAELFFVIRQITNRNATAMLVQVKAVGGGGPGASPTVDVQPMVHQIDGQANVTPHGVVYGLPCFRYAAGPFAVIMDPKVGDIGLAVFASHDISTVKKNRAPAAPGSRRRFDWADGLYLGQFLPGASTRYIQFTDTGLNVVSPDKVTVTSPEIDLVASTKVVVTSPEVDVNASTKVVVTCNDVELGGSGGPAVARVGDSVNLTTGLITTGSSKVKAS